MNEITVILIIIIYFSECTKTYAVCMIMTWEDTVKKILKDS